MVSQILQFRKAIRPLFADQVTIYVPMIMKMYIISRAVQKWKYLYLNEDQFYLNDKCITLMCSCVQIAYCYYWL